MSLYYSCLNSAHFVIVDIIVKQHSTILLKLDLLQPSGSFKARGIGTLMSRALLHHSHPESAHFYSSSGGNAGIACATTARLLHRPATVVVPTTTKVHMVAKMQDVGAQVIVHGANWQEADDYLRRDIMVDDGIYVPPFDHPDIWAGASSIVDEIRAQVSDALPAIGEGKTESEKSREIDAIVCNVGGGGLLCGIMEGISRVKNWPGGRSPKVVAMETLGADSLAQSVAAGKMVTLDAITSIATSLGAPRVAKKTFEWGMSDQVICGTVSDREAVDAAIRFADDARLLVEVACGATIAPAYDGGLRRMLGKDIADNEWSRKNIVLVVCGGSNTGVERLLEFRDAVGGS